MHVWRVRLDSWVRKPDFVPLVLLLLLALCITAPSFWLPWSLVDEPQFIELGSNALRKMAAGQILEGWRELTPATAANQIPNFGFTSYLLAGLGRFVLGTNPWAWHVAKGLQFFITLGAIYGIGRVTGFGKKESLFPPILFALFNPWNIVQDIQAYAGLWYRLFATDTFHVTFGLLQALVFVAQLRKERPDWRLLAPLAIFAFLAYAGKINALVTMPAYFLLLSGYCIAKRKWRWKDTFLALVVGVTWSIAAWYQNAFASRELRGKAALNDTWEAFSRTADVYLSFLWDAQGLLPILGGVFLAILLLLRRWTIEQKGVALFALAITIGAAGLQLVWPIIQPRYMVVFTPYLCMCIGWSLAGVACWTPWKPLFARGMWTVPASYVLGLLFIWFMLAPLLWRADAEPARFNRVYCGTIAVGVLLFLWALFQLVNRFRPMNRAFGAVLVTLPLAFLHGHIAHQLALGALSLRDFSRNYSAWSEANWAWAEYVLANGHGSETPVTYSMEPENREFLWQVVSASKSLRTDTLVEAWYSENPNVRQSRFLVSISDQVNPNYRAPRPHYWKGFALQRVEPGVQPDSYIGLKTGQRIVFPLALDKNSALMGFLLMGDNLMWDGRVDLHVEVKTEEAVRTHLVKGSSLARPRYGPPQILFEEPLLLKAGVPAMITLRYEPAEGNEPADSFMLLSAIRQGRSRVDETEIGQTPYLQPILAFSIVPERHLVFRHTSRRQSFLIASPYAMYHYFRYVYKLGRHRDFWRQIGYEYQAEIYEIEPAS